MEGLNDRCKTCTLAPCCLTTDCLTCGGYKKKQLTLNNCPKKEYEEMLARFGGDFKCLNYENGTCEKETIPENCIREAKIRLVFNNHFERIQTTITIIKNNFNHGWGILTDCDNLINLIIELKKMVKLNEYE